MTINVKTETIDLDSSIIKFNNCSGHLVNNCSV